MKVKEDTIPERRKRVKKDNPVALDRNEKTIRQDGLAHIGSNGGDKDASLGLWVQIGATSVTPGKESGEEKKTTQQVYLNGPYEGKITSSLSIRDFSFFKGILGSGVRDF